MDPLLDAARSHCADHSDWKELHLLVLQGQRYSGWTEAGLAERFHPEEEDFLAQVWGSRARLTSPWAEWEGRAGARGRGRG